MLQGSAGNMSQLAIQECVAVNWSLPAGTSAKSSKGSLQQPKEQSRK